MQRILALAIGVIAVVLPGLSLGHYWFQKATVNPVMIIARGASVPSAPVLSAPSPPQFFCRSPDGVTTHNGPHATLAAAQTACTLPTPVAQDAPQRVVFEVVTRNETVTTLTPIAQTTPRVNVFGGTALKVSDAHAALLMTSATGVIVPPPDEGGGESSLLQDLIDDQRATDWRFP